MGVVIRCTCLPSQPAAQQAALKLLTHLAAHLPHASLATIINVSPFHIFLPTCSSLVVQLLSSEVTIWGVQSCLQCSRLNSCQMHCRP